MVHEYASHRHFGDGRLFYPKAVKKSKEEQNASKRKGDRKERGPALVKRKIIVKK